MPLANNPNAQPLPINFYPPSHDHWKAYQECLWLEKKEAWNIFAAELYENISDSIMSNFSPEITARVLGWALVYAPSEEGRAALAREIIACASNPELLAGLAHLYVYGLIRVFYNPTGPTPSNSATQSPRFSFEVAVENAVDILQKPSISAKDLRQLTLLRDDSRCVFTGVPDIYSCALLGRPLDVAIQITKVVHIISQPLSEGIIGATEAARNKFDWVKTAGAMIERFGGFPVHDILGGDSIHSPGNAFTTTSTPHELFDGLDLWLLPSKDEQGNILTNTYDVGSSHQPWLLEAAHIKRQITFRAVEHAGKTIPPPDGRIIALHAACAQIAHLSGAAEHLKEFCRDTDLISCMTEPNAPYELARALKSLYMVSQLPGSDVTVHP